MTCQSSSTVPMPMTPRMIRRRRSRLRRASPKADSLSAPRIDASWVVEGAGFCATASMLARKRLQREIEHVGERLELGAEFTPFDHGRADEIPPFLRLSLGQAGGRIHPLLGCVHYFEVLSAPFGNRRSHFGGRFSIRRVGIEDRAHEALGDLVATFDVVAPRAHQCRGRWIGAPIAAG